ncbi:hypothetical protein QZH41_015987 [Actinostola sp. cb2023]|nr:hypothetical protein QZH41_015987 [Actinostola sp. cb2023]
MRADLIMGELEDEIKITTVEMHTAGEPVRIITSGYPAIKGDTILAKRRYVKENLDHLRKVLMSEPRGHFDMFGALLVEPDLEEADLGVVFMNNEGYSTMCGHVVIALGRYAIDSGLVTTDTGASTVGEIPVFIQCPCGIVKAFVELSEGKSGRVRFVSVPAFAFALNLKVETEKFGTITIDVGYGGNFAAVVDEDKLKLKLRSSSAKDIMAAGIHVLKAVRRQVELPQPDPRDVVYIGRCIITSECSSGTNNVSVFGIGQLDRSPCGSGVTARIAVMHAKKQIGLNQRRTFQGKAGEKFEARIVSETRCGEFDAVQVEVSGRAFFTGTSTFTLEKDDPLKHGFLLD